MVGNGQEVALELHTYVAAIAVVLAAAVAHTGQLGGNLRVSAKAYVPRIHRVFEQESAFELAELHASKREMLPFAPSIHYARSLFAGAATHAVNLHLQLIGKVAYFALGI